MTKDIHLVISIVLILFGILLFGNGLFHLLFHLIDGESLFSGLRYISWISFLLGSVLIFISIIKLRRIKY